MVKFSISKFNFFNTRNYFPIYTHGIIVITIILSFNIFKFDQNFNFRYLDSLNLRSIRSNPEDTFKFSQRFTLLDINDPSFHRLAKSHGSIRISVAKLILNIKSLNPKAIVCLFPFYGKGTANEELYLTAAADSKTPIFFLSQLTRDQTYLTPLEALNTRHPYFGFLSFPISNDEVYRYVQLYSQTKNMGFQFDLTSQIASILLNSENPVLKNKHIIYDTNEKTKTNHKIITDDGGLLPIKYKLFPGHLKIIPALEIIDKNLKKEDFENKIIIIEGSATVFENTFLSPIGKMTRGALLVNSLHTVTKQGQSFVIVPRNLNYLILILLITLIWSLCCTRKTTTSLIIISFLLALSFPFFEITYNNGVILDYGSIWLSLAIPWIYRWFLLTIHIHFQSQKLTKLVSLDTLTSLYTFRYFILKLQEQFTKQLRKKKVISVFLFQFTPKNITTDNSQTVQYPTDFIKKVGTTVLQNSPKESHSGYNPKEHQIFISIPKKPSDDVLENIYSIKDKIIARIISFNLNLNIKIAQVDSKKSKAKSSYHLIQILQTIIQTDDSKETPIINFEPSRLKSSLNTPTIETDIPQTDLDYISLQINQDKKDISLLQDRLSKSLKEVMMAHKLSAMGQLSSYYAHELKNPLHNLLSCLDVLKDKDESTTDKNEMISIMNDEINRMIRLSDKMRSYFKPSEEEPIETNINKVISDAQQFLKRKFLNSNVKINLILDENIPNLFLIHDQIKQVFLNLFLNALEAMPNGGNLVIQSHFDPPLVRITVTDNGKGMKKIDLERIFEAFYTTKKQQGTGLGLFACYNIIRQNGGTLIAKSEQGKGSTFEINLPT